MGKYFHTLNYSMGDEDSSLELELLPQGASQVVAVAGCGGRVLPLLAKRPRRLVCVDILPEQLAFTRLRLALLARCEREEFLQFLGYRDGMSALQRARRLDSLGLPDADHALVSGLFGAADGRDPIYLGRFERMLQTLHRITRLMTGEAGRGIFATEGLEAQREYYLTRFPRRRWNLVVALLGNSAVLNSLLYRGDFPRNNLGISSFQRYQDIFEALFTQAPARDSFFLQMVFFGKLVDESGFPVECRADVFAEAKRALLDCETQIVQADAIETVAARSGVDFVSISDVPSFLPDDIAQGLLQRMRPALADDALVVTRGHMRVVRPDSEGFAEVSDRYLPLIARERTQLWHVHVYRKHASESRLASAGRTSTR
ncbi:DUF3419 family protein [Lysobacter sp. CA199]|uniref:DUF3419 family protein n=1 Tax=Lysobacter sp. CA199 TaxID=3455608 RepID=UPI003F8D070C